MFSTYRWRLNSGEIVRTNMKRLCGFAILRCIAPSGLSVGLSVALSVCHTSEPCKNGWKVKLPFAFRTRVGPMNHVLHEVQMPTWEGAILRGDRQTIIKYRDTPPSSVQTRLNRSRCRLGCGLAWAESITCYMGGPDPQWKEAILVDRGAHCKV